MSQLPTFNFDERNVKSETFDNPKNMLSQHMLNSLDRFFRILHFRNLSIKVSFFTTNDTNNYKIYLHLPN